MMTERASLTGRGGERSHRERFHEYYYPAHAIYARSDKHMWNAQNVFELVFHLTVAVTASFAATEVGGFNAFSPQTMMSLVIATAGCIAAASFWTFGCAMHNVCVHKTEKPPTPPIARSVFGWLVFDAAWWTLMVYFYYTWKNQSGPLTPHQYNQWLDLNWGTILVGVATSWDYWTETISMGIHYIMFSCGATNPHLKMLF